MRRPRFSQRVQQGVVKTLPFACACRASLKFGDLELAEDQKLEDLHLAIEEAFGWMDSQL